MEEFVRASAAKASALGVVFFAFLIACMSRKGRSFVQERQYGKA